MDWLVTVGNLIALPPLDIDGSSSPKRMTKASADSEVRLVKTGTEGKHSVEIETFFFRNYQEKLRRYCNLEIHQQTILPIEFPSVHN